MQKSILSLLFIAALLIGCSGNSDANSVTDDNQEASQTEVITASDASKADAMVGETPPATAPSPGAMEAVKEQPDTPSAASDHPIRPGMHNFTLQWLNENEPGFVEVKFLEEDKYKINGKQSGEGKDFAAIDGILTYEGDNVFQFDGQMESLVSFVNGGELCIKEGTYHFRATGSRKYWRLKEKDNCEGGNVVDYFDIYF